jgi:RNA polymerase sporulation-specific sigma factor
MGNDKFDRDEVLWRRAVSGDAEAEEQLYREYTRVVRACARPYFLAGGDSEDLIQEGMMGLIAAVRQYDPAKDASFKSFAELCVKRRLYTAIKSASRFKHTPLNDSVSFESPQFDENFYQMPFFLRDPEELVIAREHVDEVTDCLHSSMSSFEKKILGLYLDGMSYDEIADCVQKSLKSVDNAVQRIRKKIAQHIKNGDIQFN